MIRGRKLFYKRSDAFDPIFLVNLTACECIGGLFK